MTTGAGWWIGGPSFLTVWRNFMLPIGSELTYLKEQTHVYKVEGNKTALSVLVLRLDKRHKIRQETQSPWWTEVGKSPWQCLWAECCGQQCCLASWVSCCLLFWQGQFLMLSYVHCLFYTWKIKFLHCPQLHKREWDTWGASQSLSQEKEATGLNVFCPMAFRPPWKISLLQQLCTSETDAFPHNLISPRCF